MQAYVVAITEKDPGKARELRSMLRNYHRMNGEARGEVMPNLFEVRLNAAQKKQIDVTTRQIGGALQFIDVGAVGPVTHAAMAVPA